MDVAELLQSFDVPVTFTKTPSPIAAALRPAWRLALVALILAKCCKSNRSSLRRIHVLSWAVRTKNNRDAFQRMIAGESLPEDSLVRFEPSLNRAIDFARAEGLLHRDKAGKLQLTDEGA